MYHEDNLLSNFNEWWANHDMKYFALKLSIVDWEHFPFKKGFNKGDILFVTGTKPEKLKLGDVIIFNANYQNPIIHRIVSINQENGKYYFSTIGDNNNGQIPVEEKISEDQLVGKARANIAPFLGWGKLIFFESMRPENQKGFCIEN